MSNYDEKMKDTYLMNFVYAMKKPFRPYSLGAQTIQLNVYEPFSLNELGVIKQKISQHEKCKKIVILSYYKVNDD